MGSAGSSVSISGISGMSPSEISLTLSRMSSFGGVGDFLTGSGLLQPFLPRDMGRAGDGKLRGCGSLDRDLGDLRLGYGGERDPDRLRGERDLPGLGDADERPSLLDPLL